MASFKIKLKMGDQVKVIAGKYRGTVDFISRLDSQNKVVFLKKASRKKYDKSTPESKKKSELKEIMVPIHISNVTYCLERGEGKKKKLLPTKIGFQTREGKKVRVARKFKDQKGNNLLID